MRGDDDADESKADKRNGESDIFYRLLGGVALRERCFHQKWRRRDPRTFFPPPLSFFLSMFKFG